MKKNLLGLMIILSMNTAFAKQDCTQYPPVQQKLISERAEICDFLQTVDTNQFSVSPTNYIGKAYQKHYGSIQGGVDVVINQTVEARLMSCVTNGALTGPEIKTYVRSLIDLMDMNLSKVQDAKRSELLNSFTATRDLLYPLISCMTFDTDVDLSLNDPTEPTI